MFYLFIYFLTRTLQVLLYGGEWAITAAHQCQKRLVAMNLRHMVSLHIAEAVLCCCYCCYIIYYQMFGGRRRHFLGMNRSASTRIQAT